MELTQDESDIRKAILLAAAEEFRAANILLMSVVQRQDWWLDVTIGRPQRKGLQAQANAVMTHGDMATETIMRMFGVSRGHAITLRSRAREHRRGFIRDRRGW